LAAAPEVAVPALVRVTEPELAVRALLYVPDAVVAMMAVFVPAAEVAAVHVEMWAGAEVAAVAGEMLVAAALVQEAMAEYDPGVAVRAAEAIMVPFVGRAPEVILQAVAGHEVDRWAAEIITRAFRV